MPRTTAMPKPIREPFSTPEGASGPMGGHVPHPPTECPYKFELHDIFWADSVLCVTRCEHLGLCTPAARESKRLAADRKMLKDSRPKLNRKEESDDAED